MRESVSAVFALLLSLTFRPLMAARRSTPPVVGLPEGAVSYIPSPDRKWTLIFDCPNDCSERTLWLEDASSHTKRLVNEYKRNLAVSWAPDGRFFFVNDDSGSTDARCYVYNAASLGEADVAKLLLTQEPDADQFLNSGHSYLRATRWLNSHELLVVLTGHNDGAPPFSFTLRYRVDLSGKIHSLSRHIEELP